MQTGRGVVGMVAIAMIAVIVAGCFNARSSRPVEGGGHYLITQSELDVVAATSMYDAVLKLRPHFLRNRSATAHGRRTNTPLMLYVNGERMESVDDLRRLTPSEVMEVRFYEPQVANTLFARYNNAGGAIAIRLRRLDG